MAKRWILVLLALPFMTGCSSELEVAVVGTLTINGVTTEVDDCTDGEPRLASDVMDFSLDGDLATSWSYSSLELPKSAEVGDVWRPEARPCPSCTVVDDLLYNPLGLWVDPDDARHLSPVYYEAHVIEVEPGKVVVEAALIEFVEGDGTYDIVVDGDFAAPQGLANKLENLTLTISGMDTVEPPESGSTGSGGSVDCNSAWTGDPADVQVSTQCATACSYASVGNTDGKNGACSIVEDWGATGSCTACP